jgi:[ribosomal protein S5]-alanine N-acetyltransferase
MQITHQPIINTDRLTVRFVEHDDLPAILEVNNNDAVTRYLPYASWKGMDDAQAWYERALTRHETGVVWQFVIVLRESERVIGTCLLFNFDAPSRRAETGYVLGQPHWSKGYAKEAMSGLVRYAFDVLDLHRLEAQVDARNDASCKLLERLGFAREGLLRQRFFDKGEFSDAASYRLLREQ